MQTIGNMFEARDNPGRVKLLSATDGNAAEVRRLWIDGGDVMHFSTHGLANLRQPLASLLLLPATKANGDATYLTAGQVQEWRGDFGLVFLGACETAVGPTLFADGMPGLQRAFLRAGAHGVVATLWKIEDTTASQFAADFYRHYLEHGSPSEALRETQRAWLATPPGLTKSDVLRRQMTAWAHVYYGKE